MHSLAIYCKQYGKTVSGSDVSKNEYTKQCKAQGIDVYYKHKRKNIEGADLVVYSSAIDFSNTELVEADRCGVKVVSRAEFLASVCKNFKCVIGVSGTHGKSTTCAMIYSILKTAGKKVSCHIGADVDGARLNPYDEYLVLECCEYNRSFLNFDCDIGIVLNVDNDHLDCYANMYNLRNAFIKFLKQAKTKFIYSCHTTSYINLKKVVSIKPPQILKSNMFMIDDRKYTLTNTYGQHNITNATVAVEVCKYLGVSYTNICKGLKKFEPVGRRCELIDNIQGCDILTDYAHHPTEIKALYDSLAEKYNQIYLIFQPHTYSRTQILLKEFIDTLAMDNIIIYKEYSAREHKFQGCTAKKLWQSLNVEAFYCKSVGQVVDILKDVELQSNMCIVFVGAGDINQVGLKVSRKLNKISYNKCNELSE